MCGIHGFNWNDDSLVKKMIISSTNRGPDASDYYCNNNITLGHNLLSIIDKKNLSIQPWHTQDKKGILTYNGEIYNFLDIKNKLIFKNALSFKSNTDTEVIAEALNYFGLEIVNTFDGMFAFAFYNVDENALYLVRDKFGIKPLYYFFNEGVLIFSSDINSILLHSIDRAIDYQAISLYLDLGYVPGKKTHFKFINKLEPGEIIKINLKNNSLISYNYNSIDDYFLKKSHNQQIFRESFEKSITKASIGIRDKGLYLSGGFDSSTVYHEMSQSMNIDAFSTKFDYEDQKFNEDYFIAKDFTKEKNQKHFTINVNENNFVNSIDSLVKCLEVPVCNQNLPAYYLAASFLNKKNKIITFAGDGGDETFSGYPRHLNWLKCLFLLQQNVDELNLLIQKKFSLNNFDINRFNKEDKIFIVLYYIFTYGTLNKYYSFNEVQELSFLEKIEYFKKSIINFEMFPDALDIVLYCERFLQLSNDFMLRGDKIGMSFSMEARFPILSNDIQKYCAHISFNEKIVSGKLKQLIRNSYKNILPAYILNKKKTGWSSPVDHWFNNGGKYKNFVFDSFESSKSKELGKVINFGNILNNNSKMVLSGNNKKQFYSVLYLLLWIKSFNVDL